MVSSAPVEALGRLSRTFGSVAAADKLRLLDEIAAIERLRAADLAALHDVLCFMRAYPDSVEVLRSVERVGAQLREWIEATPRGAETARLQNTGFPGGVNRETYSFAVAEHMLRIAPLAFDLDWEEFDDDMALHHALVLVVTNGECQGLDDIRLTTREWVECCKMPGTTDLEFVLGLFAGSHLRAQEKAYLYDSAAIPVRYALDQRGAGRCELTWQKRRISYQRRDISRERKPLGPVIEEPFESTALVDASTGAELIDLALRTLCSRNLEISSLMYANPRDVRILDAGRGLQIALVGVVPEYRDAHEITYFHLILKNGVPVAYGPASVCLGCCEMGVNLFPEFRGGEIRFIYGQFMRVLHQVLGARYFYLTSYGMGEGNPEAIRTGAFWFYRKLGFRASNPDVEALACAEEERMRAEPGYRSSVATLRRLSVTDAYFDMSDGECARLNLGAIGVRQSQLFAREFGGDRRRGIAHCVAQAAHALAIDNLDTWPHERRRALRILAPTLRMIGDLDQWPNRDRERMLAILRAKGGRSEANADRLAFAHARFRSALRLLAAD